MNDPCFHPTVLALSSRVLQALPESARATLPAWLNQRRLLLNEAIVHAFGDRLQLVELFAGIGGLGSGLETALNAVTILQAERVPERRAVLRSRFPLAHQVADVRELPELPVPVPAERLVVAGGFPCRGASRANLTGLRGMQHAETGLWSVMAAVIRRWRPRLVVLENVVCLRTRGLNKVLSDLADAGYSVLWGKLTAAELGAPHERARLFGIALRPELPPLQLDPRGYPPAWLPWASPIPANDFKAPGRNARVAALGDAVLPIVAYSVGLTAVQLLNGWRPSLIGEGLTASNVLSGDPPLHGWLENGRLWPLVDSPLEPAVRVTPQRWVVVDERWSSPGLTLDSGTFPPALGRIVWWDGVSDNVDVEVPGGEVIPFPPEWVKHGPWPTPTANDARNRGARAQFDRASPGLNALVQTDEWIAEDGVYAPQLLDLFSGRGVGPGLLEWMMGFKRGWTAPAAEAPVAKDLRDASGQPLCAEAA